MWLSGGNTMSTDNRSYTEQVFWWGYIGRVFLWSVFAGDVKPHKAFHLQSAGIMLTVSPEHTGMLVTISQPVEGMQQQPEHNLWDFCLLCKKTLVDGLTHEATWKVGSNKCMLCKVQQSIFDLDCDAISQDLTY